MPEHLKLRKLDFADKKAFLGFVKGYLGKIVGAIKEKSDDIEDDVERFQKQATEVVKDMVGKYADVSVYTGPTEGDNGAVCFRHAPADSPDATFYYFMDSIKSVKL